MIRQKFQEKLSRIVAISKKFGAKKVLLFGSTVDDPEHAHDIDVAVSGIAPKDFFRCYADISMELKDPVDLVDLDDADEYFHQRVLTRGKVLYAA